MKDLSKSSDSIVFECDLPESPDKVWRALTQPELLAQWLTPNEPFECEVLSAEPNRFLRYKWRETERGRAGKVRETVDSIVTFELSVMPTGGTHLRLIHSDFVIHARLQTSQPPVSFGSQFKMAA